MPEAGTLDRLRALPKPELHVHALGAMRPETIVELARARNAGILPVAERGAAEGFAFPDLTAFVSFFIGLFELVSDRDAFARVQRELLEDAARAGARHVEVRWSPWSHLSRGVDEDEMFEGLQAGASEAARGLDVTSRLILTFPRTLPLDVAETTLAVALRRRGQGVVGIDIAGDEATTAVDPAFGPIFEAARTAGLGVTAHAGEGAGAASVAGALDVYGVRRIGHGTRAVEDEALLARLAEERVLLEVCPSSNVRLGVVPSVEAHPLRRFLDAGIRCTLSTDDPTLFGTDLLKEHERTRAALGLGLEDHARMAAWGFESAFVEPGPGGLALRERLDALAASARCGAE